MQFFAAMFPNQYTTTPPPNQYDYTQQAGPGLGAGYVFDQPRFAAPCQFYIQTPGATPPQPPPQMYQMTTDQQPPPGYQFQQYYLVMPPVQAQLNPVNPITPVTPVAQKSTSTSVVMPDAVDSKTEQTQKQNEKDSDKESKQKEPESPLTETLPQDESNGESIYLKLTKSDLEKPEWKWLLVNYSNDDDKPDKTDQGPQSVKPLL